MLSQAGPGGSLAITVLPTAPEFRMPSSHMRVLLLRRLRQPLPVAPRTCRCGGALDPLGDHRAACPTAGVLGARRAPLEWAAARVCREAGARVASNVMIRDMNLDSPATDARRIEVLANGLPLWQGAQAAVDTTLVSPLTRDGAPRPGAHRMAGSAVAAAANRKRRETYPELAVARRCKLVVVGIEVGGRFGAEAAAFLRKLAVARAREVPPACVQPHAKPLSTGGWACWPPPRSGHWPTLCWNCRWWGSMRAAAPSRLWESFWRTCAAPTTCPAAACLPPPVSAASRATCAPTDH